jgi:hypothetical protein
LIQFFSVVKKVSDARMSLSKVLNQKFVVNLESGIQKNKVQMELLEAELSQIETNANAYAAKSKEDVLKFLANYRSKAKVLEELKTSKASLPKMLKSQKDFEEAGKYRISSFSLSNVILKI